MPWKIENGVLVADASGNPIFIEGTEERSVDYEAMLKKLQTANSGEQKYRLRVRDLESKMEPLKDIPDIAEFLKEHAAFADENKRLKENTDVNKINDAVKVATTQLETAYGIEKKQYDNQLAALKQELATSNNLNKKLKDDNSREKIRGMFNDSEYLKTNGSLDASVYFDLFSKLCKIDDNGAFNGSLASDPSSFLVDIDMKPKKFDLWIEQAIQEYPNYKSLLKGSDVNNPGNPPNSGLGSGVKNPFAKDSYNVTEQHLLYQKDPALAERLAAQAGINI
jgi:hypothetical protein